ncbi:hypothetical protein ABGB12_21435 [Actinocorallia sp. B10E7]|uniref:hypothetical protein n=1 Tax=Actinocorallia sp. B10E7 TaxID=3153558 RepID=UPI00325CFC71
MKQGHGKRTAVFAGAALAAVTAAAFAFHAVAGDGGGLPSRPETKTMALKPSYKTLESMTASAPLVVLAEVASVKPGRLMGSPGEGSLQMRESALKVHEVLYSRNGDTPASIAIVETGWVDGVPTEDIERPWTKKGDYGYFFLRQDRVYGTYGFIGAQARVLVDEKSRKMEASGDHHQDPFVKNLEGMLPEEFAKAVRDAARMAKEGKIKPRPLGDAAPDIPEDKLPPGMRP